MSYLQTSGGLRQYGKTALAKAVLEAWEKEHPGQKALVVAVTKLEHKGMELIGKTENGYNVYGTRLHQAMEDLVTDQNPVESALEQGWAAYEESRRQAAEQEIQDRDPLRLALREAHDFQDMIVNSGKASTAALQTLLERFLELSPVGVLQNGNMGEYLYMTQSGSVSHYLEKPGLLMVLGGRPLHLPQGRYEQQILNLAQLREFYNLIDHHIENVLNFGPTGDFLKTRYIAESQREWLDLRYVGAGREVPRQGDSHEKLAKRVDRMARIMASPSSVSNPGPVEAPHLDKYGNVILENPGQTTSSSFVPSAISRPSWMTMSAVGLPVVLPITPSAIAKLTLL